MENNKYITGDYTTIGNLNAKVFMIDPNANYPLIGAIQIEHGWYIPTCWDLSGSISPEDDCDEWREYCEDTDMCYSKGDLPSIGDHEI